MAGRWPESNGPRGCPEASRKNSLASSTIAEAAPAVCCSNQSPCFFRSRPHGIAGIYPGGEPIPCQRCRRRRPGRVRRERERRCSGPSTAVHIDAAGGSRSRAGIFGVSRCGIMIYLPRPLTGFAAGIVVSGSSDMADNSRRHPEMERTGEAETAAYEVDKLGAAPARWASAAEKLGKTIPVLLLHSNSDWRVHPSKALAIAAKYARTNNFRFRFFAAMGCGNTGRK